MPANIEYFLFGMLFVYFLDQKTPIFTVYSTLSCMYTAFLFVSNDVKMDLLLDISELLTFVGMLSLESFILQKILRLRLISFFGGMCSLSGFVLFLYTLRHIWSQNAYRSTTGPFSIVRHPLHTSLLIFLAGSCVYLASFGSLFVLIWYLKTYNVKYQQLDDSLRTSREYYLNTRAGIPFLTNIEQK
ncbi:Farnesyl cysteine-carboxyl methyltransferase [Pseudoloma neurophilia]|uniref:Farnesyl cysteine-carboxyl methyltransferase n=1 Tax=Pseudoloma neurophilia TaxID=146866 RepID=A0A0R0LVR3_9MICR|nr:Farnesyl cysteine-carboxyl methyltransferase [Pseudoloma neurophilia]